MAQKRSPSTHLMAWHFGSMVAAVATDQQERDQSRVARAWPDGLENVRDNNLAPPRLQYYQ